MHNQLRRIFGSLLMCALVLLVAVPVFGQGAPEGRLAGVVHDPTGAVVAGATISVINQATLAKATTTARAEGGFVVPSLAAGTYRVEVAAAGFATSVYSDVQIEPGREYSLTVTLKIGKAQETVEVTAGQELVNTTSSEVSKTVTMDQVQNLPLNGRDVINLLGTQAGVIAGPAARTGLTTISGTLPSWSQVTLDGINIQDIYIRTNALNYIPFRPGTDSVQEFTVNTGTQGVDATLGANGVRMVTPSGGNSIHAKLYEYNRNSEFAANSWFNDHATPVVKKPFLNRNEFGGTVSGPILKNKLFYNAYYEGLRTRSSSANNMVIPAHDDYLSGVFRYTSPSTGAVQTVNLMSLAGLTPGSVVPMSIDPKIQSLYLAKMPSASNVNNYDVGNSKANLILNTAGFRQNQASNLDRDTYGFKIDYEMAAAHHFDFTYRHVHEVTLRNDLDPINVIPKVTNDSSPKLFSGGYRWTISNNMINSARIGGNLVNAPFSVSIPNPNSFVWNNGAGKNTVPGLGLLSPDITFQPQGRNPAVHQYMDDLVWIHGNHTFNIGGQYQRQNIYVYNNAQLLPSLVTGFSTAAPANVQLTSSMFPGGISSADLSAANAARAFLGGIVSQVANQTFNVSSTTSGFVPNQPQIRNLGLDDISFYFVDKWRMKQNLVVTAGLKWEYISPYKEQNGLQVGPIYTGSSPVTTLLDPNGQVGFMKEAYKKDLNNFAPAFGFAWDPFKNGKTSIRGGYSIAFVNDDIQRFAGNAADGNAGLSSTATMTGLYTTLNSGLPTIATPTFKMPRSYADQLALSATNVVWALNPNVKTPVVHEISLGVERELPWNLGLAVRYVGTMARGMLRGVDLNQTNAGTNQPYLADFARARSNGYLAQAAGKGFDPTYNPAIAGSQALTFLPTITNFMANIKNSNIITYLQQNRAGELSNFLYGANRSVFTNAPQIFLPNPGIYAVDYGLNGNSSNYHGLQIEVNRRLKSGLQFQSNYTWSKNLTGSPTGDSGQTRFDPLLDNARPNLMHARSDFDLRHVFHANLIYDVPVGKGKQFLGNANGVVDRIVGGWQVSSIFVLESGSPFSILASSRGTFNRDARSTAQTAVSSLTQNQLKKYMGLYFDQSGNPWYISPALTDPNTGRAVSPDSLTNAAATNFNQVFFNPGAGQIGNMGLLAFDGPAFTDLDLSLAKKIKITERVNTMFRADFFNAPNHPTFFMGDYDVNSTSFGRVTSTNTTARFIQFSLRLEF